MKKISLLILLTSWAFCQLAAPSLVDSIRSALNVQAGRIDITAINAARTEFALFYVSGGVTKLNTYTLDGSFNITDNGEAVAQHTATGAGAYIRLSDTKGMLAYDPGGGMQIKTLTVAKPAAHTFTTISSVQIYANTGSYANVVNLTGNIYAGCARNTGGTDGEVFTFTTDGAYDNITFVDKLIHDAAEGKYPVIEKIDATHFIVAYTGGGDDGHVSTFSVDGAGDNITRIDMFEFDNVLGKFTRIQQMDDVWHYILTFDGGTSDGWAETILVNNSTYAITPIYSIQYDTNAGMYGSMVKLTNTLYATNSRDAAIDQWIGSVSTDGNYEITANSKRVHYNNATYNDMDMINTTHIIVAYTDITDNNMVVKTMAFPEGWLHKISSVLTPSKITGVATYTKVGGIE